MAKSPRTFPFASNDHVVSKGRGPPGPCPACGSKKHWKRECPDRDAYDQWRKKNAKRSEREPWEQAYDMSYVFSVNHREDFESAISGSLQECKTVEAMASHGIDERHAISEKVSRRVSIEDVEEESEDPIAQVYNGNSILLGPYDEEPDPVPPDKSTPIDASTNPEPNIVKLKAVKATKAGRAAVGVSVLSVRGRIGRWNAKELDLRHDSCADITLISKECYESLNPRPVLRKGLKLKLLEVTEGASSIEGYIHIPILVQAEDGTILETTAEAYVVPGMQIPILLGEDYQNAYEISVTRKGGTRPTLRYGQGNWEVKATPVNWKSDEAPPKFTQSVEGMAAYTKRADHRRRKSKKRRAKQRSEESKSTLRADKDIVIPPHYTKQVPFQCYFPTDQSVIVERNVVMSGNKVAFIVPSVILDPSTSPKIPVSNPSSHPIVIRKGEMLSTFTTCDLSLDKPFTERAKEAYHRHAESIRSIIQNQLQTEAPPSNPENESPCFNDKTEDIQEDEEMGPKTSYMPDPEVYDSAKLRETLDVAQDIPEELAEEIWSMLERNQRAFAFDGRLGHYPSKVKINLKEGRDEPISLPMYSSSPAKREVIDKQLNAWFAMGVIEPSESPWGAPVVIAYRNGKPRFCVDYRKLNTNTVPDEFPIPRQTDILQALSGAQVLSSLDALSGFTQLELDEEDKPKTAFRTHRGLWQFKRLPFGLRNGPSVFQRVMQGILSPYLWLFCLVYIDDIVIFSKSYEDHIVHLEKVLGAVAKAGITLSPKKCHLFYSSILLLGHKVSRLGLSTHAEKVAAVKELASPKKASELYMFLGMAVYFSAFIPFYSDMAIPLFDLLKKGINWQWLDEHEYAFNTIKEALCSAPILAHPMEGITYRLYTDASDHALGCALQQVQPMVIGALKDTKVYERLRRAKEAGKEVLKLFARVASEDDDRSGGKWDENDFDSTIVQVERVIAYYSRRFKSAETRYSTTEREALAAKEGLVRFLPFIEGAPTILVTDHNALQWARTYENANKHLAGWGAIFSAYSPMLKIVYRPGRVHSNVDPLSRLIRPPPLQYSPKESNSSVIPSVGSRNVVPSNAYQEHLPATKWVAAAEIIEPDSSTETGGGIEQERETSISNDDKQVDQLAQDYWLASVPPPTVLIAGNIELLRTWANETKLDAEFTSAYKEAPEWDKWSKGQRFLKDQNGMLFFRDANYQPRLCVPKSRRTELLAMIHEDPMETAHMSIDKLWPKLTQRWYWKRMKVDAEEFCRSCDTCQKTKNRNFKNYGFLNPSPIPRRPYQSISWDLITGLPKSDGCDAILVIVDRLTKHGNFLPLAISLSTDKFADIIVLQVFSRFGLPESVFCDRDGRWQNAVWVKIAKRMGTRMIFSTSHHPQTDGQTEITNKTLETMLRAFAASERSRWAKWIALLEFVYNSSVSKTTGYAPFFLLLGFEPKAPSALLLPNDSSAVVPRRYSELGKPNAFLNELQRHRDRARDAIAISQHYQAKYFNRRRRAPPDIKKGSRVLVNPHSLEWIESKGKGVKLVDRWIGPFEVTEVVCPTVYRLRLGEQYPGGPTFNLEHLKVYHESPAEFGKREERPESDLRPDLEDEIEVEAIVAHKPAGRGYRYLVKWKGLPEEENTWRNASGLRNAHDLLRKYKEKLGL